MFQESPQERARRSEDEKRNNSKSSTNSTTMYRRLVVAVSGKSGRPIWSYPVDAEFTPLPWLAFQQPATVVQGRRSALVTVTAGSQWTGLALATGRPRIGPIELGFTLVRPVQYADLDGDSEPDLLALGPGRAGNEQTLTAVSCSTGRELWVAPFAANYQRYEVVPDPDWPLLVDLDGDGRSEIVVPDSGSIAPRGNYRGLRMLDGARAAHDGRFRCNRSSKSRTRSSISSPRLISMVTALAT